MHLFLLILAVFTLVVYLYAGVEITLGGRRIPHLHCIPPTGGEHAPRISIVIPACNEERHIEEALGSVLSQDYPAFEIIAVNDRSTDSTGAILHRMAARNPLLRVVDVRELPTGWLGKCHAMQTGASTATGELILFTDADVVMEPSVLRRAVAYLDSRQLDHLAIAPKAIVPGFLANAFMGIFALLFTMYTKPWKVRDPDAKEHIGIGAFNLLRASAYRAVGGHRPIAMRPDDDLKLGKLLKSHGFRQEMIFGAELVKVNWYDSFGGMRDGLMKNMFAGVEYRVPMVAGAVAAQLALFVWPFVALAVTRGSVLAVNAAIVLSLCVSFAPNARLIGIAWWWCFTLPVGALLSIYLIVRSTLLTLRNDGIDWRGTHYALSELRRNTVD